MGLILVGLTISPGPGVGDGEGVGLGVGDGDGTGVGEGVGLGVGDGVGSGVGAAFGCVVGDGCNVGCRVGSCTITVVLPTDMCTEGRIIKIILRIMTAIIHHEIPTSSAKFFASLRRSLSVPANTLFISAIVV